MNFKEKFNEVLKFMPSSIIVFLYKDDENTDKVMLPCRNQEEVKKICDLFDNSKKKEFVIEKEHPFLAGKRVEYVEKFQINTLRMLSEEVLKLIDKKGGFSQLHYYAFCDGVLRNVEMSLFEYTKTEIYFCFIDKEATWERVENGDGKKDVNEIYKEMITTLKY